MRKGFTMVEVLVAMGIIVVAFSLVTVLYIKASKIRRIITAHNEIQGVLSKMMDKIIHGEKRENLKGLLSATHIYSHDFSPPSHLADYIDNPNYSLIFGNIYNAMVQYYLIAPGLGAGSPGNTGSDTTLWYGESNNGLAPSSWSLVDLNKKVILASGSKFEYLTPENTPPDSVDSDTTFVLITLKGIPNSPSMKNIGPVELHSGVRLRNKLPF